jgi:predicted transcriptional regulator
MQRFGDLEASILDLVWRAPSPVRVHDVADSLRAERQIAYTTVQTVMEVLHRKGWLVRQKDGRAYRYSATATPETYTAGLMMDALGTTPDRAASLLRFIDSLEEAEADELRAALDGARRRKGGS